MSKFPQITSQKLIKTLEKLGFVIIRIKGSHHYLLHSDGRATVVPFHKGENIGIGLLFKILKDCKLNKEEFLNKYKNS